MSFKNLEQRYQEKVNELYAGATLKFDNGVSSNGRNDDPLIIRKPGQGYWTFAESRSTPIASAAQDVKRLTLFTVSRRGVSFLLKQQLLQTGNTFESTRVINPVFHIANAVPFLHVKRMLDIPITAGGVVRAIAGNNALTRRIFGSGAQKTDVASLRKIGQLQQETYNKAVNKKDLIGGVLKKIPVIGQTISAVRAKRSVGDFDDLAKRYTFSRPELASTGAQTQVAKGISIVGKVFGSSTLQLIGAVGQLGDNQYIVWKHRSDKNKFQTGQTTIFEPKYGPTQLYGNFDTYLNFSDNKGKWSYTKRTSAQVILGPSPTAVSFGFDLGVQQLNIATAPTGARELTSSPLTLSSTAKQNNLENKYKSDKYWGSSETLKEITDYPEQYIKVVDKVVSTSPEKIIVKFDESSINDDVQTRKIEFNNEKQRWYEETGNDGNLPFLKYFVGDQESITSAGQLDLNNPDTTNAKYIAENRTDKSKKISYIRDPSNETIALETAQSFKVQPAYSYINNNFDDSIKISFAMAADDFVTFRAYITDLIQSATPEYKPYQYIGRIEKFISYTSVQRQISFKLKMLAFSQNEVDGVWRRLNYLTGLVFPYGYVRGVYQPNIVRLTIGDIYYDQPGYITSLTTNFSELTETWDLDKQVPISVMADIGFVLIEKNTKVADSPFYGITEKLEGFSSLDNQSQILETPQASETPVAINNTSTVSAGTTSTNIPRASFGGTPGLGQSLVLVPPNPFSNVRRPPFTGFGGGGGFAGGGGGTTF